MADYTIDPKIFRDYDIRAIVGKELDKNGVIRIAQALVHVFSPKSVQVGRDMRVTSEEFQKAFINALIELGVNVVDLGLVSTDMLYFAAGKFDEDMAVTISASHNPPEYNGFKIVRKGAVAVSGNSGIYKIRDIAMSDRDLSKVSGKKGAVENRDLMDGWIEHVLSFVDLAKLTPLKIVIDTGNGMAGHFLPELEKQLPWKVTRLFYELDGTFPNHVPNPLKPENVAQAIEAVKSEGADLGMVFDGDGDRVFLIDENGKFVSGTIMTAMIAENLLKKHRGETVLYNAIVGRVVPEIIEKNKGKSRRVRVGHTLIKEAMREENAIFCGEHSGHYYFRENFFADSAIVAALLVVEQLSESERKLSELVGQYDKYASSGEINFRVENKNEVMTRIEEEYSQDAKTTDWLDGVSVWFSDWWFNLRPSNTEPFLRLNIEADDQDTLEASTERLKESIRKLGGELVI